MAQSGFIVVVPEAELLVSDLRLQYDESARLGVPAHITVLFPFMEPSAISAGVVRRCTECLRSFASFEFSLASIGRFSATCFLEPIPVEPFVELTQALWSAFPQYPPYGGAYSTVIPHLTVADGSTENAALATAALSTGFAKYGPVHSACSEVVLIENSSGLWKPMHAFSLDRYAET